MQSKLWLLGLFLILTIDSSAQFFSRKVNQLDEKGRRQGRWITWQDSVRRLPSSKIWFRDGLEYRITRYYHPNGITRLKMKYKGDSVIRVSYYDTLGHLTLRGRSLRLYTPTEIRYCWDGEWKYYGKFRKVLKTEVYRKGEDVTDFGE